MPHKPSRSHAGVSEARKMQRQTEQRQRDQLKKAMHHQRIAVDPRIQNRLALLLNKPGIPDAVKEKLRFRIAPQAQAILDLRTPAERKTRFSIISPENQKWILELLPEEISVPLMS